MNCNNIILSEEYGDFIGRYNGDISEALTEQAECTQVIDDSYFCPNPDSADCNLLRTLTILPCNAKTEATFLLPPLVLC